MRSFSVPMLAACLICILSSAGLLLADNSSPHLLPQPSPLKPQTVCPVMGGPIDKGLYVDAKGKRIYLCCAACEEAVQTEPDRYIKKIEDRGETIADTPRAQ